MADSDVKEILGFTKESLAIWAGFAACIGGLAFLLSAEEGIGLLIGWAVYLIGLLSVGYGVIKDFRKPRMRIMHTIGNIMVLLVWLLFAAVFVMITVGLFTL